MAIDGHPTMEGFEWSATDGWVEDEEGGDGWCVRDAFCQLFSWKPDSEDWCRFIQGAAMKDIPRLAEHLGLTLSTLSVSEDWNQLIRRYAHPGVAVFVFPAYEKTHTVYIADVRWLVYHWPPPDGQPIRPGIRPLSSYGWPLGKQYLVREPMLGAVIVDERQPPRNA